MKVSDLYSAEFVSACTDGELLLLRTKIDAEMRRRRLPFSVGEVGERLAIEYFKNTSTLPKLLLAPPGTKNVDALSRDGERYSIKTIFNAKKTGTIYPDQSDGDKQLFEFLLIVRLSAEWQLETIYRLNWSDFIDVRLWDKRMSAWYVGCSASTLARFQILLPPRDINHYGA